MRHLGKKPSATVSQQLSQDDTVCLVDGDAVWLLPDKYKHVIRFCDVNGSRTELSTAAASRKRRADDIGCSTGSPSKRRSSIAATSTNNKNSEMYEEEQDTDSKHFEMVCEIVKYASHSNHMTTPLHLLLLAFNACCCWLGNRKGLRLVENTPTVFTSFLPLIYNDACMLPFSMASSL